MGGGAFMSEPAKKKAKVTVPKGYLMNVNGAVDKKYSNLPLLELIKQHPSALKGLSEKVDPLFQEINVKSIEKLGSWKFYKAACAIKVMASLEEDGKRASDSTLNINKILDKKYEKMTFKEILKAPIDALSGLSERALKYLEPMHLTTIGKLADWKFCKWAEALVDLAKFENKRMES
ncbi:hypothetical protein AAMO2058_000854600 [Amorphochlora amoebiformis]